MYPFKPGSYAPKNGWYVAAFCNEIGERLLSRWILNQPVVLYRKQDGSAVAVEERAADRAGRAAEEQLEGEVDLLRLEKRLLDGLARDGFLLGGGVRRAVENAEDHALVLRGRELRGR